MHLLRVPPDHTHTSTQSNHITSSLYNSTILHTKTTRQRHIYVKKKLWESDEECEAVENEDGCSQGRRSALIEGHFLRSYEQRCFVIHKKKKEEKEQCGA